MKTHSCHLGDPFRGQSPLQRVLPSVIFDVGLPTLDVYSDFSLIIPWLIGGHYVYGASMSVPVLLSFMSITYKWYRIEKPQDKRWSWVFLLLQCWPQIRAVRVIRKLYSGHPKAYEEKRKFSSELGSIEPFLEAWPSLIIMTVFWVHVINDDFYWNRRNCAEPKNYDKNACALFGGNANTFSFAWYLITYSISFITGSFGITKLLQTGPCPILTEEGRLGGILTCSFLTHFFTVALSMTSKAAFIGSLIGFNGGFSSFHFPAHFPVSLYVLIPMLFLLTIVPNIILSFISIARSTGCNKKFFRIILDYPAIWLLPAATFFVVGPKTEKLRDWCCCRNSANGSLIGISSKLTVINVILTLVVYIVVDYINWIFIGLISEGERWKHMALHAISVLPLLILAIIMICSCFCCRPHGKCCCCVGCIDVKKHYIKVSQDVEEIQIQYRVDDA